MAALTPDHAQAALVIVDSVQRFKDTMTTQHKSEIENTTVKDVVDALLAIQQDLVKRRANRNLRKLYPWVRGLEQYSSALDVLSNGLSPYMPFIWAPIKLMLKIASDYLGAFDKLLEAYERIAETLPRVKELGDAFKDSPTMLSKLALYYSDILEFHRRAYKFVTRKSWNFFFMTMWASFDVRFDSILASMARHRDSIDQEAVTIDIIQSKKWRDDLASQATDKEKERFTRQKASVIAWLNMEPSPQEDYRSQMLRDYLPGSCDWVTRHCKMIPWLQPESKTSPVVWIHGKPGAGKSIICASLIELLQENLQMTTLYYFCRFGQADASSKILKSLALSLINKNPDLIAVIYADYVEKYHEPNLRILKRMLAGTTESLGLLGAVSPCRIVLDGVDECPPQDQRFILDDLLYLVSSGNAPGGSKLLVCSRNLPDIARVMQKRAKAGNTIALSEESGSINRAIWGLAKMRFEDIAMEKQSLQLDEPSIADLCQLIVDKADGMMLWVRLVLDTLSDMDTPRELHEAVTTMPRELSELYGQILKSLYHRKADKVAARVMRILGWLVYARRPLDKHELLHGVALTPESSMLDRWDILDDSTIDKCKPLVEQLPDGRVNLIHFTVEEYLRAQWKSDPESPMTFDRSIAFSCVRVLLDGLSLLDPDTKHEIRLFKVVNTPYSLLVYAIDFWLEHLLTLETSDSILPYEPLSLALASLEHRHRELWQKTRGTDWTSTSSSYHTEPRFMPLSDTPILQMCAALFNFRANIKTKVAIDGEEFEKLAVEEDPTLFTSVSKVFHCCVTELLSRAEVPSVSTDELIRFKTQYAHCPYRCRFSPCTSTLVAFPSDALRTAHEKLHIKRLFCGRSNCPRGRIGFKTKRELDIHNKTYHEEGSILVPPRVRARHGNLDPKPSRVVDLQHREVTLPFGTSFTAEIKGIIRQDGYAVVHNQDIGRAVDVRHTFTFTHGAVVCTVDISPDGSLAATGSNKQVLIFDLISGLKLYSFSDFILDRGGDSYIRGVRFHPSGRYLAIASEDKLLRIWDWRTGSIWIGSGHEQEIYSVSYAPSGNLIGTASGDCTARIWDGNDFKSPNGIHVRHTIKHLDGVTYIAFTADSKSIVTASLDKVCRVWNATTAVLERTLDGLHRDSLYGVVTSLDGSLLAMGSLDKTASVLWSEKGKSEFDAAQATVLSYHDDVVLSVAFSPNSRWVFTCSKDRTVIMWDPRSGKPHAMLAGHRKSVIHVRTAQSLPYLITASGDCTAQVWRYTERKG